MLKKFFLLFVILLIANCLFHRDIFARDFSSIYKTTYEFSASGLTKVNQEISLINNTSIVYVSEYSLSFFGSEIYNIEAFDQKGQINVNTFDKDGATIINLKFNEQVVGKGKILSFILRFDVSGLSKKEGNLWKISVPKLTNSSSIDEYGLIVKIPSVFGKIAYIDPSPDKSENSKGFMILHYSKDPLKKFGVTAIFGEFQTFDFKLHYKLQNEQKVETSKFIALPPDTNYQTVFFQSLAPRPKNVEVDADGNWLAEYLLQPGEKVNIEAIGKVNVFSTPKKEFADEGTNLDKYLLPSEYWESDNARIIKLAKKLNSVKAIYQHVVENLNYDNQAISKNPQRKGALLTLQSPQSTLCNDFTDLFIALSRAAGIPARELQGYAFTDNPKINEISKNADILHSWPEYFDLEKKQWIMVDPTWENTSNGMDFFNTMDMAHFAFVVHGKDSSFPQPAGSYNHQNDTTDEKEKQVFVNFGESADFNLLNKQGLLFSEVDPKKIFSLKTSKLTLELENLQGKAVYDTKVIASSSAVINSSEIIYKTIPPFGKVKFVSNVLPPELFVDYNLDLDIILPDRKVAFTIKVESIALRILIFLSLFILFLSLVIVYMFKNYKRNKLKNVLDIADGNI